jgi:hypothetical protein
MAEKDGMATNTDLSAANGFKNNQTANAIHFATRNNHAQIMKVMGR